MKRIISAVLSVCMIIVYSFSTLCYANEAAYENNCDANGLMHDFSNSCIYEITHPHKGYFECSCGEKIHTDETIALDCKECQEILCSNGLHNFECVSYPYMACTDCGIVKDSGLDSNLYAYHLSHQGTYSYFLDCALCEEELKLYDDIISFTLQYALGYKPDSTVPSDEYIIEEDYITEEYIIEDYIIGEECTVDGLTNDFVSVYSVDGAHPHKGYAEYKSGKIVYADRFILPDCEECQEILCSSDIHNFECTSYPYAVCVGCGLTKNLDVNEDIYLYHLTHNAQSYSGLCCEICEAKNKFLNAAMKLSFQYALLHEMSYEEWSYESEPDCESQDVDYEFLHWYNTYVEPVYEHDSDDEIAYEYDEPEPVYPEQNTPAPVQPVVEPAKVEEPKVKQLDSYYSEELFEYQNLTLITLPSRTFADTIEEIASQILLGNFSNKVTLHGTIGEVFFSLTGLDIYKDFSDLVYDIIHFKFDFDWLASTVLDAIAIFPIAGLFKNADEAKLVYKNNEFLSKLSKEDKQIVKEIGNIDTSLLKKISNIDASELYKYLTKGMGKGMGHTLSKHVGHTTLEQLQAIRKGNNAISSFLTQDQAMDVILTAIKDKTVKSTIAYGIANDLRRIPVEYDCGKVVGKILRSGSEVVEDATKLRMIIIPISSDDFYILTAFPI